MDELQSILDEMHAIEEKRYKSNADVSRYSELCAEASRLRNNRDMWRRIEARDYREPSTGNLSQAVRSAFSDLAREPAKYDPHARILSDSLPSERAQIYEGVANLRRVNPTGKPVFVKHVRRDLLPFGEDRRRVPGCIKLIGDRFEIRLADDLDTRFEIEVFSHECGHLKNSSRHFSGDTFDLDEFSRSATARAMSDDGFLETAEFAVKAGLRELWQHEKEATDSGREIQATYFKEWGRL